LPPTHPLTHALVVTQLLLDSSHATFCHCATPCWMHSVWLAPRTTSGQVGSLCDTTNVTWTYVVTPTHTHTRLTHAFPPPFFHPPTHHTHHTPTHTHRYTLTHRVYFSEHSSFIHPPLCLLSVTCNPPAFGVIFGEAFCILLLVGPRLSFCMYPTRIRVRASVRRCLDPLFSDCPHCATATAPHQHCCLLVSGPHSHFAGVWIVVATLF
jgi:hypothetical protein